MTQATIGAVAGAGYGAASRPFVNRHCMVYDMPLRVCVSAHPRFVPRNPSGGWRARCIALDASRSGSVRGTRSGVVHGSTRQAFFDTALNQLLRCGSSPPDGGSWRRRGTCPAGACPHEHLHIVVLVRIHYAKTKGVAGTDAQFARSR